MKKPINSVEFIGFVVFDNSKVTYQLRNSLNGCYLSANFKYTTNLITSRKTDTT